MSDKPQNPNQPEQATALARVGYTVGFEDQVIVPRRFRGSEGLSRPSRFEATAVIEDGEAPDPRELIGSVAVVTIQREGLPQRRTSGLITEAWLSATASGHPELSVIVEARIARLRHKRDARVFVDCSTPEIVSEVLNAGNVEHELQLTESYAIREYCVQYCESDLDFVQRLLEDEGIHYVCRDDGTLWLRDESPAAEPIAPESKLGFGATAGLRKPGEIVSVIGQRSRIVPSEVIFRDFNAQNPKETLEVAEPGPTPAGALQYDYPGKYGLTDQGSRKARLRTEALRCETSLWSGRGDCAQLRPGYAFTLAGGPEGLPSEQLVVAVEHDFEREREGFELAFKSLDLATPYRPVCRTSAPVIRGFLTGFVRGPEGEDIHTDELGRIKLHLPWDRRSTGDGSSSCWVPVLQDDTGHSCAIPRVGWEVLIGFIEGDPDRPMVLGRVYNGADPMPDELPANKTRSALQSLTSPGRGGANMIRIDDQAGAEQVYVQAERNQDIVIANDREESVLQTEQATIDGDETIAIDNDHSVTVGANSALSIVKDQSRIIGLSLRRKVGENDAVEVGGNRAWTIGASHIRRVEGYDSVKVGDLRETICVANLETCLKDCSTAAEYGQLLTVGGAHIELTTRTKSESAKLMRAETIGGVLFTKAKDLTIKSTSRDTKVGGKLTVKATSLLTIKPTTDWSVEATASGSFDADGTLTLKVGDNVVTLSSDTISVKAKKFITISADGASELGTGTAHLHP